MFAEQIETNGITTEDTIRTVLRLLTIIGMLCQDSEGDTDWVEGQILTALQNFGLCFADTSHMLETVYQLCDGFNHAVWPVGMRDLVEDEVRGLLGLPELPDNE